MKGRLVASWMLLCAFLSNAPCRAAGDNLPEALFRDGNASYQKGDFAAAERSYRMLAGLGIENAPVLYNLGNACYKQKKLGEAIYYWEKARRVAPGDPEISENLRLGRLLVVDRIEVPESPLPVRILSAAVHLLTASQETAIVLALFIAANLQFSVYLLARNRRAARWALSVSLAVSVLILPVAGSLAWKIYEAGHRVEAVIIEPKADVRSGPATGNITVVTVHEGTLVFVLEESGGWYRISLPNGWTGWLPSVSLRIL
jgi:tetratricopeptide (TPR) repeat protein